MERIEPADEFDQVDSRSEMLAEDLLSATEANVNPIFSEHLREDVQSIYARLIKLDSANTVHRSKEAVQDIRDEGINVLHAQKDVHHEVNNMRYNMLYDGDTSRLHAAVISDVDSSNKFSLDYYNCTGVVAVGIDRETGDEISFLSHQDPNNFLLDPSATDTFVADLEDQLTKLHTRAEQGTVDMVVFGGRVPEDEQASDFQQYTDSVKTIESVAKHVLGWEPAVFAPKLNHSGREATHAFFDTVNRRLYIIQTLSDEAKASFKSEINNDGESVS